jgi:dCTP deaminase
MILSNEGIKRALAAGEIEITPTPASDQYTTSAVDLFLGSQFQGWNERILDVQGARVELDLARQDYQRTARAYLRSLELERDGCFVCPPFRIVPSHVLANTRERIHLKPGSRLAARVEGRSSMARLGLVVHLTAPTIHAGFQGPITLEMINHGPFYLKMVPEKTRICQLIIERLETDPEGAIATQFQDQKDPSGLKAEKIER